MGVLQACMSDLAPLPGVSGHAEKAPASNAMNEEWAAVQRAIAGDAEAQEHLFAHHRSRLYRTAFALLRNKEDAEDAVQDALCRAYIRLRSFQGRSSFSTWLTRIVINSALLTRRRQSTHPETSLDQILEGNSEAWPYQSSRRQRDPETICSAIELSGLMETHFRQLRPVLKAAFRLRAIEGFSTRESSKALGISVSAVKSRFLCARRKLARGLGSRLRCGRGCGPS